MRVDEQVRQWVADRDKRAPEPFSDNDMVGVFKALGILFVILTGGCLIASVGRSAPAASPASPAAEPAAHVTYTCAEKLAAIDTGSRNTSPDLVAQYAAILKKLTAKFPESEERIADMTVATRDILAKHSVHESLLSIMKAADFSTSEGTLGARYAEILAAYATLRTSGR